MTSFSTAAKVVVSMVFVAALVATRFSSAEVRMEEFLSKLGRKVSIVHLA
jgi:hypothetical protein